MLMHGKLNKIMKQHICKYFLSQKNYCLKIDCVKTIFEHRWTEPHTAISTGHTKVSAENM